MDQVKTHERIRLTNDGKQLTVETPYLPDMPPRARRLNGKFRDGAWRFDPRDETAVRDMLRDLYGTDGTPGPVVTIRYRFETRARAQDVFRFGRLLAKRPGRDSHVVLGPGVIIHEGGFPSSGGSVKNPSLFPDEGTVLEIRDIPADHPDLHNSDDDILERFEETADQDALAAERERLVNRIAEIDQLLGGN